MTVEVLPECRSRDRKGAVQHAVYGWVVQIYCANCGCPQGYVPERLITFAFALCQPCSDTYGAPAHFYQEPDAVFWERVRIEMLDAKIDSLTEQQMQVHVDDESSSIGKLLRERVKLVQETAE